jgi:hypothetical protein
MFLCIALSAVRLYTTLANSDLLTEVRFTCEFYFITRCSWLYYGVYSVSVLLCDVQMNIWQQRYILASTPRLATSPAYEAMYRQIPAGLWFSVGMSYIIISQNKLDKCMWNK